MANKVYTLDDGTMGTAAELAARVEGLSEAGMRSRLGRSREASRVLESRQAALHRTPWRDRAALVLTEQAKGRRKGKHHA